MKLTAEKVAYSSIVGSSIMIREEGKTPVVAIIAILNAGKLSEDIAKAVTTAINEMQYHDRS